MCGEYRTKGGEDPVFPFDQSSVAIEGQDLEAAEVEHRSIISDEFDGCIVAESVSQRSRDGNPSQLRDPALPSDLKWGGKLEGDVRLSGKDDIFVARKG